MQKSRNPRAGSRRRPASAPAGAKPRRLRRRSRAQCESPLGRVLREPRRKSLSKALRKRIDEGWARRLAHAERVGASDPDTARYARTIRIFLRDKRRHQEPDRWLQKLVAASLADEWRADGDPRASWRDDYRWGPLCLYMDEKPPPLRKMTPTRREADDGENGAGGTRVENRCCPGGVVSENQDNDAC